MLISGGRLIDPAQGLDANLDVRLSNGVVREIGERLQPLDGEEVFDASNAYVAPGFIDMHVHLREPGDPQKETIASGSAAAVAGGFTAVAAMPNTRPAIDTPDLVRFVAGAAAACRVYPIAAITRGREGHEPVDYAALAHAGAVAFSDDGSTIMNAKVMRDAAIAASSVRGAFVVHCEDTHLKGASVMNDGAVARRMHLPGCPALAEDVIAARDAVIAGETRKAWHIAHVSTRGTIVVVRAAREAGVPLTCEVTPHHLVFTDEAVERMGSSAKVNPPLRSQNDVDALRSAVLAGDVDAFATDHAPHTDEEKTADLRCAAVGFTGLEVAAGAYAYALPELPLERYVAMLSTHPARILGVPGGSLRPGAPADVTVFADRAWTVDPARFRSKGRCTPFAGMTLPRRVIATIVSGTLAYSAAAERAR